MKSVAKVVLTTLIGSVLWMVFGAVFLLVATFLVGAIKPFGVFVFALLSTKFFAHWIPIVLYAVPCIIPAWVINKLHAGGGKVRKAAQWSMCAVISVFVLALGVAYEETNWWTIVEGLVGTVMVFAMYAKENEYERCTGTAKDSQ